MQQTVKSAKYLFKSLVWIGIAYLVALMVAFFIVRFLGNQHPLANTLIADIAATIVVFIFGRIFRNASFYDPYWSLAPIVI